jgi:mRNA interferase RelE/StbE
MPSYKIIFKPSVHKDLRKLTRRMVERSLEKIEGLGETPFPANSLKLEGAEQLYRLRIGDYRVVYQVDNAAREITIHYIRHRREVYKK